MQNNQYLIELEELDAREFNPQLVKQIENYDAIKILIENDIEVIVGYDMLIYAADMGKLNVVKFIIKQLEFDSLEFDKAFVAAASNIRELVEISAHAVTLSTSLITTISSTFFINAQVAPFVNATMEGLCVTRII